LKLVFIGFFWQEFIVSQQRVFAFRLGKYGLSALAAVASALMLAPNAARASCGDYLLRGEKATPRGMQDDPQSMPMPTHPNPDRQPCDGPHCSRGHDNLPAVPVAPPSPVGEQWACLWQLISAEPPAAESAELAEISHRIHHTSPPDPPPRSGSNS
jgi:hypothetical protein